MLLGSTNAPQKESSASLEIGVTVKCILNLVLVPIPQIGAAGAAFATAACHAIAFFIGFNVLRANMKLDLKFSKFILKPIIAVGMMAICSGAIYSILNRIHPGNMVTLIAIIVAVVIYALALIALNVFTKEEILMIPYGQKILKILNKIGIYR